MPKKEYAFDVKLWAVARVTASSETEARKKMAEHLQCIDVGFDAEGIKMTEASIEDSDNDELLEIDGEDV